MQRVTDLFENTNTLYENVWSRCRLYENVQIFENLYENSLSQEAICTKTPLQLAHTYQETSCAKTCNASQARSKTQIFYAKTHNHEAFCTKTCNYFQIYTKTYNSGDHLYENFISTCKSFFSNRCHELHVFVPLASWHICFRIDLQVEIIFSFELSLDLHFFV